MVAHLPSPSGSELLVVVLCVASLVEMLCGRDNFKSQRGLSKHKLENKACRDHLKARFGSNTDAKIAAACLPVDTVHKPQNCTAGSQNAMHYPDMSDGLGAKRAKCMS